MDAFTDAALTAPQIVLLAVCLLIAFGFEFVNGFHDTANAVATVIYTNSLKPKFAVLLSGTCNFLGVFLGGIGVAVAIINLLPVELLVSQGPGGSLAMVLSLLLAAIIWNLGTWYLGLPASSSHTLIGAILGVGLANSVVAGHGFGKGVNWSKAIDIGLSLLASPVFGFGMAALILLLVKRYAKNRKLLDPPEKGSPPPRGTRALLIATCTGVSFAHGSNDGQKGVGIVMLILMGLVPAGFSLDISASAERLETTRQAAVALEQVVTEHGDAASLAQRTEVITELKRVRERLDGRSRVSDIPRDQRFEVRQSIMLADHTLSDLQKAGAFGLDSKQASDFTKKRSQLRGLIEYAPTWVLVAVALALGIGTTVGWKRIVVTVGEKIGKAHLTYAQGASAELVAMSTVGLSAWLGLPVSTTHVLSSGIAGTMVAHGSGIQKSTVKNIALAWVLTLPASMILSALLFLLFRKLLG